MNKLLTGTLATMLLVGLSACGSDETSSVSRPAATAEPGDAAGDTVADDDTPTEAPSEPMSQGTTPTDGSDGSDAPVDPADDGPTDISFPEFEPGPLIDGLSDAQSQVIHLINQVFAIDDTMSESVTLDEDCLLDVVSQLSDADADLIVDAGFEGDPELSAEGEALGDQASECITIEGVNDGSEPSTP